MIITVKLASLWVSPVYPVYQSVKVSNCLLTSQLAEHLDTYSICILMEDQNAHIYLFYIGDHCVPTGGCSLGGSALIPAGNLSN